MTFELLNIRPEIIKALKEHGIVSPTQIQKMAIPMIKSGKDMIGMANTGSGKTIAFGIPILEKIKPKQGLQILILTPTRELAVQIAGELQKFSKYISCNIATVYGGVSISPQIREIARAEIVVGTTGRLSDHLRRRTLNLSKLICLVLDEADKMIEMGFIEDIEFMLSKIPKNRQVLLFGATISEEVNNIKRRHMNNPGIAKADSYVKEEFLEQYYYDILPNEKFSLLVYLLKKEETKKAIIFCSTRVMVEILAKNLKEQGIRIGMLHGKLAQSTRLKIINDFNSGKFKILVASAVAARGLDIRNISHIFNYGLPKDPQEYIHRIGRTARAGDYGKAITLLEPRDHDSFSQILQRYRANIQKLPKESFERIPFHSKTGHSGTDSGSWGSGSGRFSRPDRRDRQDRGDRQNRPSGNRGFGEGQSGQGFRPRRDGFRQGGGHGFRPRRDGFRQGGGHGSGGSESRDGFRSRGHSSGRRALGQGFGKNKQSGYSRASGQGFREKRPDNKRVRQSYNL